MAARTVIAGSDGRAQPIQLDIDQLPLEPVDGSTDGRDLEENLVG